MLLFMKSKTTKARTYQRDSAGRFVSARTQAPAVPATDLWAPSARWLVPSDEDRARVRAAIDAADRAKREEEALWNERLQLAKNALVPPVLDCTGPLPRNWLDVAGQAMCLAPIAALAAYAAHLMRWL